MMNKNTAILDNTMMDAYLTVTEACPITAAFGLVFCKPARERQRRTLSNRSNRRRCQ